MRDSRRAGRGGNGAFPPLSSHEKQSVDRFIRAVRRRVPAELVHALLFGSKARGTARHDSDVDLLLIFRELPLDREPQATIAEELAEEISEWEGVPVAPWSVSLIDLQRGMRTPMLVDALEDGVPIWPADLPSPCPPFTPEDALRCTAALLQRVEEGSEEVAGKCERGDFQGVLRRARDDVVRMCTAALLLHGETRPRHAHTVRRFIEAYVLPGPFPDRFLPQLGWAAASFGPQGKDEDRRLVDPPGGFAALAELVDRLRDWVATGRGSLADRLVTSGNHDGRMAYDNEAHAATGASGASRMVGRAP